MAGTREADPQDVEMTAEWDVLVVPGVGIPLVSGEQAVAQAIRFRLQLELGEWFLNRDVGSAWYDQVLGDPSKTPGVEGRARAIVAAAILDVPAVDEILQLEVTLDRQERRLRIRYQARCSFGDTAVTELTIDG